MTPTTSARGSRAPRGLAFIFLGVLLAACSPGAASVAPSATAAATPVATPEPSATPTASATETATPSPSTAAAASASAQPDPAEGLKIAAPYKLSALDPTLETAFRTQFTQGAGSFADLVGVGGRTVTKDGKLAGYVLVMSFPAGLMTDVTYQTMLTGMESGMGGDKFTTQTISGEDVSIGAVSGANIGILRSGDHVVLTLTPTPAELPTMAKALIDANK